MSVCRGGVSERVSLLRSTAFEIVGVAVANFPRQIVVPVDQRRAPQDALHACAFLRGGRLCRGKARRERECDGGESCGGSDHAGPRYVPGMRASFALRDQRPRRLRATRARRPSPSPALWPRLGARDRRSPWPASRSRRPASCRRRMATPVPSGMASSMRSANFTSSTSGVNTLLGDGDLRGVQAPGADAAHQERVAELLFARVRIVDGAEGAVHRLDARASTQASTMFANV